MSGDKTGSGPGTNKTASVKRSKKAKKSKAKKKNA